MVKDQQGLDPFWEEAADQVAQRIAAGKDVAFITIGDPFLYSTYLYIHRIFLAKYPEIKIEVIPGISSILASSAVSGLPLGLGAERIAILPATYEHDELKRTLEEFDTVVLMKVNRVFDAVYAVLKELGRDKGGVFVRRVGSGEEEVHFDLEALVGRKLDYLSMLIVRKNPL
jgi:precorrin-2/cobalt-factor-2 C20-methyltransferase